MAAAIKNKFGLDSNLIAGHNGIFEVSVNNKVIYDKKERGGKFPEHEEIIRSIDSLSA